MSMEICAFVPNIDDSIIAKWLERMASVGMNCEIHPGFSFSTHRGFLPFKLELTHSDNKLLTKQAYLTGFEFYLEPFDLSALVEEFLPSQGMFSKLLGQKPPQVYFVNADIDERLSHCRYSLSFVWKSSDIFELRMATVSAAILAELCGGLCSFPADNIWYNNQFLVEDCVKEANDYENSFKQQDIKLYPFTDWIK